MKDKALVVIDLQNDITKNYKKIIGQVNAAIDWAVANEMHIIYIKHYNLSEKTRTFKRINLKLNRTKAQQHYFNRLCTACS